MPDKENMNEDMSGIPSGNIPEGWATPPSLRDLKQNLDDSKSFHDEQVQKRDTHLEYMHVTGSVKPKTRKGRSSVQPKLIRKHAEWRYAALSEAFLATEDMFTLKPRTHRDKLTKEQNQLVLNYQWNNEIDKVTLVDELVRTGVDEGSVFFRIGWESQEEEYEEEVPIYEFYPAQSQEQVQELQQAAMVQQRDPYAFKQHVPEHIQQALQLTEQNGQPIYPVLVENEIVVNTRMLVNRPTVEVCNMANLYIDPLCNGVLEKAEFAIYSFETSKSDLKKSGTNYFNLDKLTKDTGSLLSRADHEVVNDNHSFNFKDDARAKLIAYEYWGYWDVDGSGMTIPIVATWIDSTLIRLEPNPYPDQKIPFVSNAYLPVRKSLYGDPDGVLLRENQSIIGAITRGHIDTLARSAAGQKGFKQDALDSLNQRKFENGDDYFFNPMYDARTAVIDHTYPELGSAGFNLINMHETDANNMTGVRPYGATDSSAGTATADRGVLDAATKRETGILRRFARSMQIIAKKIIAMNAAFLSDEEIIRITDDEFVAIRREDLGGNYDIEVNIATAEEDNTKAKELAFMLQTMGNTLPLELSQIVLADIAKLRKMPNLAKRIEDYKPQPDPVQQELQMVELEKAKLELAELQGKVQKLQTSAQLDMARASEAGSRAGNIQSDTDNKNLDFLNKESGVEHSRSMQKDQAQAEGNMALEILKADLLKDNPKPQ